MDKANDINSTFFLVYVLSMFGIISLFVAVSFMMHSAFEVVTFLFFPANLYCVAGIICALGQSVMDSVRSCQWLSFIYAEELLTPNLVLALNQAHEMEVAMYDCDWYSAPPPFRKLILMFMIRCKRATTVEAKPFYRLNFALLMKVSHYIYRLQSRNAQRILSSL